MFKKKYKKKKELKGNLTENGRLAMICEFRHEIKLI